ncbi:MAG TPA: aspartate aminotransferase family protein [Anaerolineae bacterium]|nr:aspartate aminotransferase family protein [Anaerolineales bacterium]HRV91003.1 aspartate aminotransferase family protein [Anaerolineae bacterium]
MNYEEIYGLESKYTSGGVGRRPVALVKAQGARLWDSEGNVYIDCAGAQGWANVGHSHPVVTQAIKAQLDTYVAGQESSYNDQRALWMRDLAEVMQTSLGWDSCYIHPSNSGTEAIEAALKFARYQTGRPNIVATMRGFHGRTMGSLSATWNKKYREPFEPLVPGFNHVPYDNIEAMTEAIDDTTAAVLVEIVQGEGGVFPGSGDYFAALRQLCSERGALLIVDEIQTGVGRTGRWLACEHHALAPDVVSLGKSIGGGLPMGVTVWRSELGQFQSGLHGSTFGGNPLVCAASRAVIEVMAEEQLPQRAEQLGAWTRDALEALPARRIREVRGLGLMIGIELRTKVTPVLQKLMERGVWALPAGLNVLRLLPPLVIDQSDLEQVVKVIDEVLS